MEKHKPQYNTSIGPSMYPTMKSGDAHIFRKMNPDDEIKPGDVIVFTNPTETMNIVHRVIKKNEEGYITRGDNNNLYDPYIVTRESVIGVVEFVIRNNKKIRIRGGLPGLIIHKTMLLRKYSYPLVSRPAKFIIKILIRLKLFFFVGNFLELKVIKINRSGRDQFILNVKGKPVGKRDSTDNKWNIKFPYSLFINESKLK